MHHNQHNTVCSVSVSTLVEIVSQTYEGFIKLNEIAKHPAIFIEGKPGVGKSQSVFEIAKRLKASTQKNVEVTDIRLLLFNPIDLRGIPVVNKTKDAAIWLKPFIFNLDASEEVINLLFLDELTAAPISVQAAAYQLVLDRRIGEHTLPKNTFVIAAGNGINDYAVSHLMPTALRNRFIHYRITENLESFKAWAKDKLNPFILDFLERFPNEFISKDLSTDSNIIITPRSWEMLSMMLDKAPEVYYDKVIASVVGERVAKKMLGKHKTITHLVVEGKPYELPSDISDIHTLTKELENIIPDIIETQSHIENTLQFLLRIPLDYAISVFRSILQQPIESYDIESLDPYQKFIKKLDEVELDHA